MPDTNSNLTARRANAIPRGVGLMNPVFAARAENAEVWDVEGRRYIDFAAGIAVVNTGHRHPKVVQAITAQLEGFTHTCHHVLPYTSYVTLAERLNLLVPGDFAKKTCFVTTGAEAVENAVKIARARTGRDAVIAFGGGFHGRTYMGMSLTGKVAPYRAGFGSMMGDTYHVPFPTAQNGISAEAALAAVRSVFQTDLDPSRAAAIIIEPVQGEGGFNIAPKALMTGLRELCDEYGILLIADEIQTGFGRTGQMFAMEHFGVAADLTCMAKGLAGGMPLAAVTGRAEVMDAPTPGGLGGTYGGNPLAIASALAVLDVLDEEQLCQRASKLGADLMAFLRDLQSDVPELGDVRGLGFMVAAEFVTAEGTPNPEMAQRVKARAMARGLILLTCGVGGNVIRFLAPLTIPDVVFAEALGILSDVIHAAREAGE
ncbi:4-aminobutyrate--2-oxoglutarate transaminase [Parasedimentitalea maritima]|uniref:4-aminobutyrate--2-oxoglutarate transaminase n=1 Tax=Parasedimentitalea maritima TaxID=2578117 RepID=A0ABY2UTA7_9RHOB|nr:4-aminobutyrate--2-oxoglutarate transaminase [Zongyanglinia marina]TLP61619.1 4-aminobutyrate--2-oxoglutarate transaminase [Zongyanglinia marina]